MSSLGMYRPASDSPCICLCFALPLLSSSLSLWSLRKVGQVGHCWTVLLACFHHASEALFLYPWWFMEKQKQEVWLLVFSVAPWPSVISSATNAIKRDYSATTHAIFLASCTVVFVFYFLPLQDRLTFIMMSQGVQEFGHEQRPSSLSTLHNVFTASLLTAWVVVV